MYEKRKKKVYYASTLRCIVGNIFNIYETFASYDVCTCTNSDGKLFSGVINLNFCSNHWTGRVYDALTLVCLVFEKLFMYNRLLLDNIFYYFYSFKLLSVLERVLKMLEKPFRAFFGIMSWTYEKNLSLRILILSPVIINVG